MSLSNQRTTLLQKRSEETGEVDTILRCSNSWGNDSAPPSAQHTLGIPGGDGLAMTQQAMTFTAEGHAPTAGTKVQNLHMALMGGTPMLYNTGVGGNGMREVTGTVAAPLAETGSRAAAIYGKGKYDYSALTLAVKFFGPAATTPEFLEKQLKWQADVSGELTQCTTFKTQAVEADNLPVFFGMVKGDMELKLFNSMLK